MTEFFNKPQQKSRRRELRMNSTKAEKIMWTKLRNRQFLGLKFKRQYGIGYFIVDFYCRELKLILEIDGAIHVEGDRPIRDTKREEFLLKNGFNIKRYTNEQILKNIEGTLIDFDIFCRELNPKLISSLEE